MFVIVFLKYILCHWGHKLADAIDLASTNTQSCGLCFDLNDLGFWWNLYLLSIHYIKGLGFDISSSLFFFLNHHWIVKKRKKKKADLKHKIWFKTKITFLMWFKQ